MKIKTPVGAIIITLIICIYFNTLLKAQSQLIGFYNCENFYDTIDQRPVFDEDFLPNSNKHYSSSKFENKVQHLAQNIYELGKLAQHDGLTILGLAEIENRKVLEQLVKHPILTKYHYQIIHFDSPDPRGIDVALLFTAANFTPYQYKPISLARGTHLADFPTRDILYVKGRLAQQWVHIFVNHWPSRRGGQAYSQSKRIWASQVLKHVIDSINDAESNPNIIVMGDFNDNPNNKSIQALSLFNPFAAHFNKGDGSLAFGDSWHLFDQILVSKPMKDTNNYLSIYKSIIYKNNRLVENSGRFIGYPKRTWNGDRFNKGYSDHFPVAVILSQKSTENPLK